MTAPGRNLGDVLLDAMLGEWRDDIESVPFPDFADLLIPATQRRSHHIPSPECWCQPCAAPGRWQHRGPEPREFEPGLDDFQPTAIHQ